MGQWDQVERAAIAAQLEGAAHDFVELFEWKKLRDRKFPDRNDKSWLEKIDLIIHPRRTIPDLVRSWNAVPTRAGLSGKTAAHSREINFRANLFLVQSAELLEPAEERSSRSPGERFTEHGLFHPGRLTD